MHRSRVSAICLDVPKSDRESSEGFWSGALGRPAKHGEHHEEYSSFGSVNGHEWLLQAVGDATPRVHLDIHTDDREAEVRRLIALGAVEHERHDSWVVMKDPAGITFCVVPVPSDDETLAGAVEWT